MWILIYAGGKIKIKGMVFMCGIFGFVNYGRNLKNGKSLLEKLAWESSIRGTDATGYSFMNKGKLHVEKAAKEAYNMKYTLPKGICTVMGHTRATTQGSEKINHNNHPFIGKHGQNDFAFAHNGMLYNEFEIRDDYGLPTTKIQTDSYVACQLMELLGSFSMDNLKTVGEATEGSFVFTFMDSKENLYIVKNDNPISILHFPELGLYVYASTENILFDALVRFNGTKTFIQDYMFKGKGLIENILIEKGDIVKIKPDGTIERSIFKPKPTTNSNFYKYSQLSMWQGWENDNYSEWENKEDEMAYREILLQEAEYMAGISEAEFKDLEKEYSLYQIEELLYSGNL